MDTITRTALFGLLRSGETAGSEEWEAAWLNFAAILSSPYFTDAGYPARYNALSFALAELETLPEGISGTYALRAGALLRSQLCLLELSLQYPAAFVLRTDLAPAAKWTGTLVDLLELLVPLHKAGLLRKPDGREFPFAGLVETFGNLLGVAIPNDLYDRKTKMLMRKKNPAPLLDRLRRLFLEEVERIYR